MERRREDGFVGFADVPGAAETWLRSDLLRVMKRRPEEFAVARPVHALAARVRGPSRVSSDSDASLIVYDWLHFADPALIDELRDLIQSSLATSRSTSHRLRSRCSVTSKTPIGLALARSRSPALRSAWGTRGRTAMTYGDSWRIARRCRAPYSSITFGALRLFISGSICFDSSGSSRTSNKTLVPHAYATRAREGRMPTEPCPYRLEMLVDCGEDARSPIAKLAEESWARQEDMLGRYIRSHLALKKLHEFAESLKKRYPSDAVPFETVDQIAAIETGAKPGRLRVLLRQSNRRAPKRERRRRREDPGTRGRVPSARESSFRTYVALLAYFSERRWLAYQRQLLDSLFDKNSAEGAMRQPLGGRRLRRMALGASLLETLTLIAVVERRRNEYATRPLRVDRLITHLDERYDLLVSRPPERYAADPEVLAVLAGNVDRLKARLRETGLYTDLSDAFLAQTVKPRIILNSSASK